MFYLFQKFYFYFLQEKKLYLISTNRNLFRVNKTEKEREKKKLAFAN